MKKLRDWYSRARARARLQPRERKEHMIELGFKPSWINLPEQKSPHSFDSFTVASTRLFRPPNPKRYAATFLIWISSLPSVILYLR